MARRGKAETGVTFKIRGEDKSRRAFNSLNGSLKNTARTLAIVQGPLGPVAGRFTALASIMGNVSLRAIGVTATFTGLALAVKKGLTVYAQTEKQFGQLEAQLNATGFAAGKSARELEDLAQAVARETLASLTEVRTAQGILLSFKSISEDAFDGALRAAQDLSAAGFGSITDAAKQLGKAMEDPATGLSMLRRAGVTFSASQQSVIKNLSETGKRAEALQLILEGIAGQVGGAGAGAGTGTIVGSFDSLSQSLENFFSALGKSVGGETLAKSIEGISMAVQDLAIAMQAIEDLSGADLSKQYQDQLFTVSRLGDQLARLESAGTNLRGLASTRSKFEAEKAILQTLEDQLKVRRDDSSVATAKGKETQTRLDQEAAIAKFLKEQAASFKGKKNAPDEFVKNAITNNVKAFREVEKRVKSIRAEYDPLGTLVEKQTEDLRLQTVAYGAQSEEVLKLKGFQEGQLADLKESLAATEDITKEVEKSNRVADRFGRTIARGFTDALLEAEKLSDVVKAIMSDIVRATARAVITEPLGAAISGGISPFLPFGGAKADGGPVGPGKSFLVGEKGPELLVNPGRGNVLASGGGGVNIQIINNAQVEVQTQEDRAPDGSALIRFIINTISSDMTSGGLTAKAMGSFGAQQVPAVR